MHVILRKILIVGLLFFAPVLKAESEYPASLILIPETVTTVFVAETSSALFHRFRQSDGVLTRSGSFPMSIGQAGPGKQRAGDQRTPLGAYFVTEQLDTSRMHEKYGVTAFPLDYPNEWDEQAERSGDGIWVHGVLPNGGRRPDRDTDGCIAIANEDLEMLAADFADNVTPVLVTRQLAWVESSQIEDLRSELESLVELWVDSKATGDLHAYLSLYGEQFRRWDMNKAEWLSFQMQTREQRDAVEAEINDLLLLAYPDEADLYLSRFRLTTVEDSQQTELTIRLFWRRNDSGTLKIVAEDEG